MNSKPMLYECLGDCKESYLADNLCDGYRCPKCNGHIVPRGFIEQIEENIKDMQYKIKMAKRNGLIRNYYKYINTPKPKLPPKPKPCPLEQESESELSASFISGVGLSDKKDHTTHTIKINVSAENIDKDKLIEQIIKNINNSTNPRRSGYIG